MPAPPEHARAPEVAHAALKEATDLFGRLLAAAIRNGTERGVMTIAPELPHTKRSRGHLPRAESKRPVRHVNGLATNDDCGAWRDAQRRDARRPQADDPLVPLRARPAIGHFTIMELGPNTCRFPLGDGPFWFCGATPVPGKPYCAGCIRGLYRSPDPDEEVLES